MISDDPALFHKYGLPWMGATWSIPENARLWADAVRTSRARYGAQSTAKGLLCTNWGGGRIERNVPIVAELSWNLYQYLATQMYCSALGRNVPVCCLCPPGTTLNTSSLDEL